MLKPRRIIQIHFTSHTPDITFTHTHHTDTTLRFACLQPTATVMLVTSQFQLECISVRRKSSTKLTRGYAYWLNPTWPKPARLPNSTCCFFYKLFCRSHTAQLASSPDLHGSQRCWTQITLTFMLDSHASGISSHDSYVCRIPNSHTECAQPSSCWSWLVVIHKTERRNMLFCSCVVFIINNQLGNTTSCSQLNNQWYSKIGHWLVCARMFTD